MLVAYWKSSRSNHKHEMKIEYHLLVTLKTFIQRRVGKATIGNIGGEIFEQSNFFRWALAKRLSITCTYTSRDLWRPSPVAKKWRLTLQEKCTGVGQRIFPNSQNPPPCTDAV
jgi:hypothetical protein